MPKVLNMRYIKVREGIIYVGRKSPWGNPFIIGKDGTREEVIEKYKNYIRNNKTLLSCIPCLRGYDLVCWCAPLPCHADYLLWLANRCTCLQDPVCDSSCEFFLDEYNSDGDCIMTK